MLEILCLEGKPFLSLLTQAIHENEVSLVFDGENAAIQLVYGLYVFVEVMVPLTVGEEVTPNTSARRFGSWKTSYSAEKPYH